MVERILLVKRILFVKIPLSILKYNTVIWLAIGFWYVPADFLVISLKRIIEVLFLLSFLISDIMDIMKTFGHMSSPSSTGK